MRTSTLVITNRWEYATPPQPGRLHDQEGMMDPVAMILTALAGGAAAAAQETASQAVKDAYAGLKALVQRKLQPGDPGAATVVAQFEKDSETWEKPMLKSLAS